MNHPSVPALSVPAGVSILKLCQRIVRTITFTVLVVLCSSDSKFVCVVRRLFPVSTSVLPHCLVCLHPVLSDVCYPHGNTLSAPNSSVDQRWCSEKVESACSMCSQQQRLSVHVCSMNHELQHETAARVSAHSCTWLSTAEWRAL